MQTIVIIGAGPGLGLSLARQFGSHGFRVALLARKRETLEASLQQLRTVEAAGFQTDIKDPDRLQETLRKVKETYGSIDVLCYNRGPSDSSELASVLDLTYENVQEQLLNHIQGAVASVQEVLPDMLTRGSGTLFFITGVSSVAPIPAIANVGIAMAGLRNYAQNLREVLTEKGIYVGHLIVATGMRPRIPVGADPDRAAALIYEMCQKKEQMEATFRG